MSHYYGNVKYYVLYLSNNRGDKIKSDKEQVRLNDLQQYTIYSMQVQAVRNGEVVVESGWKFVRTSGKSRK